MPTQQLVGHERRDEIDRREPFGLRLAQSGVEDGRHPGEAEFAQGAIEFDEIHAGSAKRRRRISFILLRLDAIHFVANGNTAPRQIAKRGLPDHLPRDRRCRGPLVR